MKYIARRIIAPFIIGLLLGSLLLLPFILSGNSTAGAQPVIADTARMETTSAVESPATAESEIVTTPIYDVPLVESQVPDETDSIYVPIYRLPLTDEQQIFVQRVAGYYNIDPAIVYGIMATESGFDNYAENGNCKGIMQVDQRYAQQWYTNSKFLIKQYNITNISDLFDFRLNVILGCEAYSEWNQIIVDKEMDPLIDTLGAYNNGYNYIAQPDYSYSVDVINFAYKIQMQERLYEVSL